MKTEIFSNYLELRFIVAMLVVTLTSIHRKRTFYQNLTYSILIIYIAYGIRNTAYVLLSVIINTVLLKKQILSGHTGIVLNIINVYVYKIIGLQLDPRIQSTFDITGFLMILTIKMSYLFDSKDLGVKSILDYVFFIPGLLTGPTPSYSEFINRDIIKNPKFPLNQFSKTLGFGLIHILLKRFDFLTPIIDTNQNIFMKILNLFFIILEADQNFTLLGIFHIHVLF